MMFKNSIAVVSIVAASLVSVVTAIPQVATVTVSQCPLGKCTKICPTPTVTVDPAEKCSFDLLGCPVARCVVIEPKTVTSTTWCKAPCTTLTTTGCEKLPTVTVVPPCPTKCPELCPIPIETAAVACPTTITF